MITLEKDASHYMKLAFQEAEMAFERDEVPVGAVIVSTGKVIARAHNQVNTLTDATAHAEMIAITSAQEYVGSRYLNECDLYVTLEPCRMCAGALYWTQIRKVHFGAYDDKQGFSLSEPNGLHPKTTFQGGIMEAECSGLIQEFFRKMRDQNPN